MLFVAVTGVVVVVKTTAAAAVGVADTIDNDAAVTIAAMVVRFFDRCDTQTLFRCAQCYCVLFYDLWYEH